MLRFLKRLLLVLLLLAIALPIAFVVTGLQGTPEAPVRGTLTQQDMERAQALFRKYDPRRGPPGGLRTADVPQDDLADLLTYAAGRLVPAGVTVDLSPGVMDLALTLQLPDNPLGRYFNTRWELIQVGQRLEFRRFRLGGVDLPAAPANWLLAAARGLLARDETYAAVRDSINGFRMTDRRLLVLYQWQPALADQVKARGTSLLVSADERQRLLAYGEKIAQVTQDGGLGRSPSLVRLLAPVFAEATQRTAAGGAAAEENRAAILALMLYIQGVDLPRLLGEPADPRYQAKSRGFRLDGRGDFVEHFMISAGLAVGGGSNLANAVGLFKEVDDSRGGSGFSFTDLAADRAGVRFAEVATGPRAAQIQRLMAEAPAESIFMPQAKDLPEFMPEAEFKRRYGGIGQPGYEKVAREIESRIAALPIHDGGAR